MKKIVTRFAPSPTGDLHIGGARTALFAYLHARHHGGKFLLRIEDTDKDRSTSEAVNTIIDGLKWLGLEWDDEPVFQSTRANRHIEVANTMLANGSAYHCYLTAEEAANIKKADPGKAFRSPWRDGMVPPTALKPFVVRLRVPDIGEIVVNDIVKGEIRFNTDNLDDLVLLRSDGSPTYNLAVVVDDFDMGINVIPRGNDHVNNTPRQILIYKAMGWDIPDFAHIPLIHGEDGKPLSKRHGDASVMDFKNAGYLPETMRNYLARLGWGHGDADIFSDAEAIEWFDIKDCVSSPARMNTKKLNSVNQHYINAADDTRLMHLVWPLMPPPAYLSAAKIKLFKAGAHTIPELAEAMNFVYYPKPAHELDTKAIAVLTAPDALTRLKWVYDVIASVPHENRTVEFYNQVIHSKAEEAGYKMKDIGPVLRVALTGKTTAPDLGTCIVAVGDALSRIDNIFKSFLSKGDKFRIFDSESEFYDATFVFDKYEDGVIRVENPPLDGFGLGMQYFLKNTQRLK